MAEPDYVSCDRKIAFQCQRCGRCCTDFVVPLGYNDLQSVKAKAGSLKGKVLLLEGKNAISNNAKKGLSFPHPCPFFDKENAVCTIHDVRPKTCLIYPFFTQKVNGKVMYSYDRNCPGVNNGEKIDLHGVHKTVKKLNSDIKVLKEKQIEADTL